MPPTCDTVDPATAVKKFQELFEKSVKKQLVADVPVGAFLSGGLDSSTVVGVASKYKEHLKTFSFGFGETINELPYAQEIADKFTTEHQILKAENYDIAELILEMAEVYDEPFADSSNIPTYLISKLASQHLKVILTGDGADELLGGYDYWYRSALQVDKANIRYPLVKKIIKKIMGLSQNNHYLKSILPSNVWIIIPVYLRYDNVIQEQEAIRKYFSDEEISELFIHHESFSLEKQKKSYSFKEEQSANDALRMDLEDYMPGDILVKIDRASMAHGLELRAPFLDPELAALCISLPVSFKINKEKTKILLRNAYEKMWTPSGRKRKKQGFGAPVHEWLRLENVKNLKKQYLRDEQMKIFKIFSFKKVQTYISRDDYKTWILLVLSIWMEKNEFLLLAEVK
jgi:asparagine synthase (glutamine-hydrolysing)